MIKYNCSLDFKAIRSTFRFEKGNPQYQSFIMKYILPRCKNFNGAILLLKSTFYKIIIVPTTDEDIEIEVDCYNMSMIVNKNNLIPDIILSTYYYCRNNLKLVTTLTTQKANIECYDFDYEKYNKDTLDLYYFNIKEHFHKCVLDNFRSWSKKLITKTRSMRKREYKRLPI
jgi:hypothetical protein